MDSAVGLLVVSVVLFGVFVFNVFSFVGTLNAFDVASAKLGECSSFASDVGGNRYGKCVVEYSELRFNLGLDSREEFVENVDYAKENYFESAERGGGK